VTVRYASTRGAAPELDFGDVLLAGLAADGGLYCPTGVPALPDLPPSTGTSATSTSYAEIACLVMWPFVEPSMERTELADLVSDAYTGFRHPDVCPVLELGDNHYLLDLTRGPTLAFKDVALQLVGRLLDYELSRRDQHVVVLTATSGDTGSAAIEALANRRNITAVVLHPHNRVSEVQRRQMTTVTAANVCNLAVEGTFDDCQDLLKAAFSYRRITDRHQLVAVNSINWARVMAQIVYYVTAARAVSPGGAPVSFSVPTGNFGNILAGWYAKEMGLAIDQLIAASNRNDVLTRFFETGELATAPVVPTLSPSMDIGVPSNFERLLWEASGRDGEAISALLSALRAEGRVVVPQPWAKAIRHDLSGARLDDAGTLAEIERVYRRTGIIVDPHTAVGLHAATAGRRDPSVPMITLATADPAKFPDAVERAIGQRSPLPPFLAELHDRRERYEVVANDLDAVAAQLDRATGPGR
jgi:threonine synthase